MDAVARLSSYLSEVWDFIPDQHPIFSKIKVEDLKTSPPYLQEIQNFLTFLKNLKVSSGILETREFEILFSLWVLSSSSLVEEDISKTKLCMSDQTHRVHFLKTLLRSTEARTFERLYCSKLSILRNKELTWLQ